MGNFISPSPKAAEIREHFLIIISLGINTVFILKHNFKDNYSIIYKYLLNSSSFNLIVEQ